MITKEHFGTLPDGKDVHLFTIKNDGGITVRITNYGGAITSIEVPDQRGVLADVVLGYETLAEYVKHPRYFGCLVGRYANRIASGKFKLNGVEYQLAQNNGKNHLHGGIKGFDKVVWNAEADGNTLRLSYLSVDGEENYPGNLQVTVNYVFSEANEIRIEYRAKSDQDTIINLTNHSYFNLAGLGSILAHELMLNASGFTPISSELIPTGEIRNVDGSPMDFTESTPIGSRIEQDYEQLKFGGGYDHNFVLRDFDGSERIAARAVEPVSGRVLEVLTTQPGIQFYSGNFLDGSITGKGGVRYNKRAGFCLETQHFPDSPNHENFPSTVLRAGESFSETTVFRFSTI